MQSVRREDTSRAAVAIYVSLALITSSMVLAGTRSGWADQLPGPPDPDGHYADCNVNVNPFPAGTWASP